MKNISNPPVTTVSRLTVRLYNLICAVGFLFVVTSAKATVTNFNSPGIWTCPPNVTAVQVECWGGGGGSGGTSSSATRVGGGGAGGAYVKHESITVIPGTNYTVTVGAGGTNAASGAGGVAGAGGSSSFAGSGVTTLIAVGGTPGISGTSVVNPGTGGVGSTNGNAGYSGSFSYAGGNGGTGTSSTISGGGGGAAGSNGAGGNASGGTGGIAGTGGANGSAGVAPTGAGTVGTQPGGGASGGAGASQTGAAGGAGRVTITYSDCAAPVIATQPANAATCTSGSASFTVVATGTGLAYQWRISTNSGSTFSNLSDGGIYSGATTATLTISNPPISKNGSQLLCALSGTCGSSNSTAALLTVAGSVTPAVGIASDRGTSICAGVTVIYTATPTNGGASPTYVWKTNGVADTSSTSATYTNSALINGETINCRLTSSDPCASPTTANAAQITMTVSGSVTPSVSISPVSPGRTNCAGTTVIFTATPVNGGATPGYQWKLNGNNVGVNSSTYTNSSLADNDSITVVLTASADVCVSPATATSSAVTMTVKASFAPAVAVAANPGTSVCAGTTVIFTATPTSGGAVPAYSWQTNGVPDSSVPAASATYTNSALVNGETVAVVLTPSAEICVSPAKATNSVTLTVTSFSVGGGSATLIDEGFGTSTTNDWTLGSWTIGSTTPLTNGVSLGKYANFTPGTNDAHLLSPTVDATGDTSLQLSYYSSRNNTYTGGLLVEASSDGGSTWTPVMTNLNASLSTAGGSLTTVPLGASFDNQAQVAVRFSSSFTGSGGGSGGRLRVDDVTLTGTAVPAATSAAIVPTPANATNCSPGTVSLAATAGGAAYQWSSNTVAILNETNASYSAAASATYSVAITDSHACHSSASQAVTINPLPTVNAVAVSTTTTNPVTLLATNLASAPTSTPGVAGNALSVTAVGTPAHGTATLVSGVITYTATGGYTGTDSFTFTVSESDGCTRNGNINVTVNPETVTGNNLSSPVKTDGTNMVLTYDAIPGRMYYLQHAEYLTNPVSWVTFPDSSNTAPAAIRSYTDVGAASLPKRYYRAGTTNSP